MDWFLYDNGLRHERVNLCCNLLVYRLQPQENEQKNQRFWRPVLEDFQESTVLKSCVFLRVQKIHEIPSTVEFV